jgi:FMN-dependent oxidoreductase (nitrilotriacetate monooxygenase family)
MGWFASGRPHGWTPAGPDRWAGVDVLPEHWESGEFLIDFARSVERAGFDYVMLEDHLVIGDDRENIEPRLDPLPVMAVLATHTSRVGIVGTFSTSFYPPFLLARQMATLDHLSRGRAGWNIVTSTEPRAAQAFGGEKQPAHDERYDRADEYIDLVNRLWGAWTPDAYELNETTGRYVDPYKVEDFVFDGQWIKSRGPLNTSRSPQGRPVLCQAGSSPRGREFASRSADTIICSTFGLNSVQALKDYRDDVRARMVRHGRDPDQCKVMFLITPVIGDSEQAAKERHWQLTAPTPAAINQRLQWLTFHTNHDWYQYDLNAPLPPIDVSEITQGYQGMAQSFIKLGEGGSKTLLQMIAAYESTSLTLVGTPEQVADRMQSAIEEIGGDGFLIESRPLTRRYISEICDGLIPVLQKRGLVRKSYEHALFRDNLMAF